MKVWWSVWGCGTWEEGSLERRGLSPLRQTTCGLRYLYLAHPAPPGTVRAFPFLPFVVCVAVLAAWHPSLEVPLLVLVAVVWGNRSWSWL